jgi:putative oxidoreductase
MKARFSSLASRYERAAYAALRIVSGLLFAFHGVQKILGWYARVPQPAFGSQMWIGGMIELVGGVLIAIGLFTRPAAFICSGTMAVAYIQFHWKLAFAGGQWLPALNRGELSAVYCFLFLYIAAHGAGVFSVENRRRS